MQPIISVRGLGKRYHIGAQQPRYGNLRESLASWARSPLRAFRSRIGQAHPTIWALKDVSFDLMPGEILGIIGRNGAGKTTLLKVLSRITEPTEGEAKLWGRVASLLEVGTGFHPELTGRENIFLNGAILGMRKAEIDRKFDEIVSFAEVERFIDTPVKRYSSGMYVRLAFAVAAHLEPDILIVDEVLAVGDASFQKKCLGKMREVGQGGRTVLFVSHNMAAVNLLCTRAILLSEGAVRCDGPVSETVNEYLSEDGAGNGERVWSDPRSAPGGERVRIEAVRIVSGERVSSQVPIDQEVSIEVEFMTLESGISSLAANIYLLDSMGVTVLSTASTPAAYSLAEEWFDRPHPAGRFRSTCTLSSNFLNDGVYHVSVFIVTLGPIRIEAEAERAVSFTVFDTGTMRQPGGGSRWHGVVRVRLPWRTQFLGSRGLAALGECPEPEIPGRGDAR